MLLPKSRSERVQWEQKDLNVMPTVSTIPTISEVEFPCSKSGNRVQTEDHKLPQLCVPISFHQEGVQCVRVVRLFIWLM